MRRRPIMGRGKGVDARDPVGYGSAWIAWGRETELQRCGFRGRIEFPCWRGAAGKHMAKFGGPVQHSTITMTMRYCAVEVVMRSTARIVSHS